MTDAQNRRADDKRAPGPLNWDDLRSSALTAQLAPGRPADRYAFTITPRAEHVGGGWRLQLFEDGQEVGGGVYPVTDEMTRDDANAEAMADGEAWMSSRGTDAQVLPKDEGAPAARSAASIEGLPDKLERIAQSWDGCKYDAPGEMVDIGASLRRTFSHLAKSIPVEPS